MKKSEIIAKYADAIAETMVNRYREVLKAHGINQYKVYVWEDGEIECLHGPQGDNSFLSPRDNEPRDLVYVDTVSCPCFDPWEVDDRPEPEDEAEREKAEAEIIDWCVEDYENSLQDRLDVIIANADEY